MDTDNNAEPGWAEQLGAIATGYLSRRIDVDLANRLAVGGTVARGGNQTPIYSTPATGMTADSGPSQTVVLAALAAGAVVLFLVLRKG